jgi:hypothetical protein
MYRTLTIATLLLAAACGQQESAPPAANEAAETAAAPDAPKAVPLLEGEWQVTAIDGKPVEAGSAMTASFGGGKASIAAGCIRRAWTYTQKGNIVSFATDPGGSANCGGNTPDASQETASAVLDKAAMAIFSNEGKQASLSGTGGNLTLERR